MLAIGLAGRRAEPPENHGGYERAAGDRASQPPLRRDRAARGRRRRLRRARPAAGDRPDHPAGRLHRRDARPAGSASGSTCWRGSAMPAEGRAARGRAAGPRPARRPRLVDGGRRHRAARAGAAARRSASGGCGSATGSSRPVVLAAAGGALIWRQSASAADPAPSPRGRRPGSGCALGRAALGVALIVGAGLLFLHFGDAFGRPRRAPGHVVVVVVAGGLILAPWCSGSWRARRRARGARSARRSAPSRRAPARLRAADARAHPAPRRRPREVAALARAPGARAAGVAVGAPPGGGHARGRRSAGRGRGRGRRTACRSSSWSSATRRWTSALERSSPRRARPCVNAAELGARSRRRLRPSRRGHARRLRARPRPGLRPRRGARRPARRQRVDRRADERDGGPAGSTGAGRGHRGRAEARAREEA